MDMFEPCTAAFQHLGSLGASGSLSSRVSGRHVACAASRSGFTLPEFLVAAAIAVTLMSMSSAAILAAKVSQRKLATRDAIAKLDAIVAPHYVSYRRLNVEPKQGETRGELIRNVVRGDLPDGWGVVKDLANGESQLTARQQVYVAIWQGMAESERAAVEATNGSAECLFMIVMQGGIADCLDCRSMLIDIGDQDGDGMPEFLDAWGRPIGFVLQPSGLRLPAASDTNFFTDRLPFESSVATVTEARARVVRPLIFSAGPDGIAGLNPDASPLAGAADTITNFDEEAKR